MAIIDDSRRNEFIPCGLRRCLTKTAEKPTSTATNPQDDNSRLNGRLPMSALLVLSSVDELLD
jgi:hypothetical protein